METFLQNLDAPLNSPIQRPCKIVGSRYMCVPLQKKQSRHGSASPLARSCKKWENLTIWHMNRLDSWLMTDRYLVTFQSNGAMMNLTMLNLSRRVLFSILLNLFLQVDTRSFPCGSGGLGERQVERKGWSQPSASLVVQSILKWLWGDHLPGTVAFCHLGILAPGCRYR